MTQSEALRKMLMIRMFEEKVEEFFAKGELRGTTHGCIGQEMLPVALSAVIDRKQDYVFATHRCHGHFLAYSEDPFLLASELMGRVTGPVHGAGGSQHIKYDKFYTNGITGGMAPIAVGLALGMKEQGMNGIVVSLLGDGGFNEGYVQEALNIASFYSAPVLFILENNKYAMSTNTQKHMAGSFCKRVESYNLEYRRILQDDYKFMESSLKKIVNAVRNEGHPIFCEVETFRLCGHSKSDKCEYMDKEERASYIAADPLNRMFAEIDPIDQEKLKSEVAMVIDDAFLRAQKADEIDYSQFRTLQKRDQ